MPGDGGRIRTVQSIRIFQWGNQMELILGFVFGAVFGAAIALLAGHFRGRATRAAMIGQFRDAFAALSSEALSANNEQFLALARQALSAQTTAGAGELEKRKELIDQSIRQIGERMEAVRGLMGQIENARKQDYGQLGQRLAEAARQTAELRQTTETLRAALAHPQRRGQWGERMAGDILQMAGMIEGVNYSKQQTLAEAGNRPDFTFNLPNGVKLNMDVKFPLDNYLRYLEAADDDGRSRAASAFVADVRNQVRALATKSYIDPTNGTAEFVLMFIPNEQMFGFIQELDTGLLVEAARRGVVLVGPLSLLAVLAITRQAAESANLARQTGDAIQLVEVFAKQWILFKEEMDKLGQKLDQAVKQFESLRTTRTNVLEKPIERLRQLRHDDGSASDLRSE
jgi:DNA recombination protein RmuC